ncbi:MAG: RnfABCDGE type electron transport complex subunit B [Clostridiales bacterium]|nr:RnfABCDGE type electron transport complex subunit B [Clostridiales bacterium]
MEIIIAALVLGGMGILFGLVLTFTSKVFAVPSNPKRDAVREALPGANCGGCGYPGCDGCADAIAAGKAPVNACPVCSADAVNAISDIMGVEKPDASSRKVARVICQGDVEKCKPKFDYTGIQDCVAASTVNDGNRACKYACLGLGTCVKACAFDAIHIDANKGIAVVDEDKCVACGKCVEACPKGVLDLMPVTDPVKLLCRAAEEGHLVSDNCRIGCIGCERCYNACKFGAITMVNNLPVIDMAKCRGCMMCAEACPTNAIWADWDNRKIAEIDPASCVGCTMCKRNCPFEAIAGTLKQVHEVTTACTGCGLCVEKCPKKCITLKIREHTRDRYAKVGTTPDAVTTAQPAPAKPARTPEQEAKIKAALEAKAAREAAAKAEEAKTEA